VLGHDNPQRFAELDIGDGFVIVVSFKYAVGCFRGVLLLGC